MPKLIDYPRASFQRCLDLAKAVDFLGGNCAVHSCADQMGLKVTGGFSALIGAAKKHDLVEYGKEKLTTTLTYQSIGLAYDDVEKFQNLRTAFLAPPVYNKIYEKFKGKELPIQMLDKLMIREFAVDKDSAQRIANYFIDGARFCEILIDSKIIDINSKNPAEDNHAKVEIINDYEDSAKVDSQNQLTFNNTIVTTNDGNYIVHIIGPGLNSKIEVSEEEDFVILDAMISKLKRKVIL